jgi:hypothetical protein
MKYLRTLICAPLVCRMLIHIVALAVTGSAGQKLPGLIALNADTGVVEPLALKSVSSTKLRLTLVLDGGAAALMKFNTGQPFVGIGKSALGESN